MKSSAFVMGLLGLVALFSWSPAYGQATRTWVSGAGNDANPCSRSLPCATFAAAMTLTAPGGEISVLDGGGFGSLTIDRSISIYNEGAGEAGVLTSNVNAIVINAAASDIVNLRGLVVNCQTNGAGNSNGIRIASAARVTIENSVIQQCSNGLNVVTSAALKLDIRNTTIRQNNNGVVFQPTTGSGSSVNAVIEQSRINSNTGTGLQAVGSAGGSVYLAISDSSISLNGSSGISTAAGPAYTLLTVTRSHISGNAQFGISAAGTSSVSEVVVADSVLTNNFGGATQVTGSASIYSPSNNLILFKGPATLKPFPLN